MLSIRTQRRDAFSNANENIDDIAANSYQHLRRSSARCETFQDEDEEEEKKTVFYQHLSIATFQHIVLVMVALLHTF